MIIDMHREIQPSFGIGADQRPLHIWTLLCLGGRGDDCAAYRGITPDMSMQSETAQAEMLERVRRGGNKISEHEAREIFGDLTHEGKPLSYRR